jgi:hypothetical protein
MRFSETMTAAKSPLWDKAAVNHDACMRLHEALETLLSDLADRADQRRLRPRTQVSTDLAAPDRKREPSHMHWFHVSGSHHRPADRTTVGNGCGGLLAATDLGRDIQRTEAGAIFVEIGVPVVTRTDEVDIPLSYS